MARVKGGLNGVAKRRQTPALHLCHDNVSMGTERVPAVDHRTPRTGEQVCLPVGNGQGKRPATMAGLGGFAGRYEA